MGAYSTEDNKSYRIAKTILIFFAKHVDSNIHICIMESSRKDSRKVREMAIKDLQLVNVRVGNSETGYGSRGFYGYERAARNRFIREQVNLCGKENVKVTVRK